MKIKKYQVDAFANNVFEGNPAAVCPLNQWLTDEVMQHIAMEHNLSETAFFVNKGNYFEIRWFAPEAEVDLCGHATLATAHVLFEHLQVKKEEIIFQCARGKLSVKKLDNLLQMDFPSTIGRKVKAPAKLLEALALEAQPIDVFKADDYMLVVDNQEQVEQLEPDFSLLKKINTRGIIVTAPGNIVDFVSRFFAPAVGIDEDPVTGSAHTMMVPYWAEKLNKVKLSAQQLSPRGGKLQCTHLGKRTLLGGSAVTYSIGEIFV